MMKNPQCKEKIPMMKSKPLELFISYCAEDLIIHIVHKSFIFPSVTDPLVSTVAILVSPDGVSGGDGVHLLTTEVIVLETEQRESGDVIQ